MKKSPPDDGIKSRSLDFSCIMPIAEKGKRADVVNGIDSTKPSITFPYTYITNYDL